MAGSAKQRVHGIAFDAFQEVSAQSPVSLHVPNDRFNSISPLELLPDRNRHAPHGSGNPDLGTLNAMTAIASVDISFPDRNAGQLLRLIQ